MSKTVQCEKYNFITLRMYALNRIKLIGYLTENTELKTLPSGTEVCELNLKVISKISRDGGIFDSTSFHSVTCWSGMAKTIVQYTQAGSQIYIEGRLKTDSWENEEGKKRYKTKVVADDMILLTPQSGAYPAVQSQVFSTGINEVELVGNLTKDLEVRQTPSGQTVGTTSVATNRRWKDRNSGEMREETEFHNLVLWNELASEGEVNIKKGQKVYAKGRIQTRSWDSPEGEKRYTTEVIVENVTLLGHESPGDTNTGTGFTPAVATATAATAGVAVASQTPESAPEIPSIQYESNITPDDLPF